MARMRRLALLRHTAFPDFLPAIKATRPCWPCCFVGNTMNVRYGVCRRLPHENRSEISPRDLMVSNLKLSLHAETLAPLGATSSQHLAAALRRHTSTETVALSPFMVLEQPRKYSSRYGGVKENSQEWFMIFSRSLRIERTQGKVSSPWKTSKVCSECPRPRLDGYFFNRFPLFCAALLWKMLKTLDSFESRCGNL